MTQVVSTYRSLLSPRQFSHVAATWCTRIARCYQPGVCWQLPSHPYVLMFTVTFLAYQIHFTGLPEFYIRSHSLPTSQLKCICCAPWRWPLWEMQHVWFIIFTFVPCILTLSVFYLLTNWCTSELPLKNQY